LLYLDLDRFKDVNDTLGHPVGDALLRDVARRLLSEVRNIDAVARLGGDEFAVVQSGVHQPSGAQVLAERLIEVLGRPYAVNGHHVVIGVSIGIALAGGTARVTDVDTLMRNADLALYRAKEDGRGNLRFFDPEMDAQAQARHKLETDLRVALEQGQFELHYQPLVSIREQRVSGFEALLRWHHPTRGLVSPGEFTPLAEEIGLIVPIGDWVLQSACAEAAGWHSGEGAAPRVAVNVSAVQFIAPGLVETVERALAASGLTATRLELEITEGVLLHDVERTLKTLHALRTLGVHISMDDFGTGYSSLAYLRSFPFDKIKIDQSFVRNLAHGDESSAIVRAIAALGASLRITTLAEGVETQAQLEQLIANGCTEVQGYFFSPPIPAHQVAGLLAESNQRWVVAA
jgi:diguanylate cyclase (GGDEF)-like protein